jgi:hypothetical protein
MLGRALAVGLLAVSIFAAVTTAAVTVPISGPYPALHATFKTVELPAGTPQALQAEPIAREWSLDYLDDTHWTLELTATSDDSVTASDTMGRQVAAVGDFVEADGTLLRSGNSESGTASEGALDTSDSLPPYVRGATEVRATLEEDRPSDRFDGSEVAGHPTYGWKVIVDIACRDLYAECTENAPPAFEALATGLASQEETWLYDMTTDFPMVEEKKVANVTVFSYRVDSMGFAES